jgi:hypothetical protein
MARDFFIEQTEKEINSHKKGPALLKEQVLDI